MREKRLLKKSGKPSERNAIATCGFFMVIVKMNPQDGSKLIHKNSALWRSCLVGLSVYVLALMNWIGSGSLSESIDFTFMTSWALVLVGITAGYWSCGSDRSDEPWVGLKWAIIAELYFLSLVLIVQVVFWVWELIGMAQIILLKAFSIPFLLAALIGGVILGLSSRLVRILVIEVRRDNYKEKWQFKKHQFLYLFLYLTFQISVLLFLQYFSDVEAISTQGANLVIQEDDILPFFAFFMFMTIFFISLTLHLVNSFLKIFNVMHTTKEIDKGYLKFKGGMIGAFAVITFLHVLVLAQPSFLEGIWFLLIGKAHFSIKLPYLLVLLPLYPDLIVFLFLPIYLILKALYEFEQLTYEEFHNVQRSPNDNEKRFASPLIYKEKN